MKFTEAQLEQAFIHLLSEEGIPHVHGVSIPRENSEVLILEDLKNFLQKRYAAEGLTAIEANGIIRQLQSFPASDLYESNKAIMKLISDGFTLKREDRSQKDIYVNLIDFENVENNVFKIVNQLEIEGFHKRIP